MIAGLTSTASNAYTAAGDRNFPAQLILPQIGPTDALWFPISTLPMEALKTTDPTRVTNFRGNYSKLITEELGIRFNDGFIYRDRLRASSVTGAENFRALLQHETILDPEHEFLLSVQVGHEFGGTGDPGVGSEKHGATTPGVTFGKGLGDLRSAIGARSRSPALPGTRPPKGRVPTFFRPASPSNIQFRISRPRWRMLTCPHFYAE